VGVQKDSELEETLGLVNKRVIGFVGSFYAYEGLKLLVAAVPALLSRDPGVRLLLVGGGQEADDLRKLVKGTGISLPS